MADDAQPNDSTDAASLKDKESEEHSASYTVPAPYVNRFWASLTQSGMRISFAEVPPSGQAHFRSAVLLAYDDALALSTLINEMIKTHVKFYPAQGSEGDGVSDEQ